MRTKTFKQLNTFSNLLENLENFVLEDKHTQSIDISGTIAMNKTCKVFMRTHGECKSNKSDVPYAVKNISRCRSDLQHKTGEDNLIHFGFKEYEALVETAKARLKFVITYASIECNDET